MLLPPVSKTGGEQASGSGGQEATSTHVSPAMDMVVSPVRGRSSTASRHTADNSNTNTMVVDAADVNTGTTTGGGSTSSGGATFPVDLFLRRFDSVDAGFMELRRRITAIEEHLQHTAATSSQPPSQQPSQNVSPPELSQPLSDLTPLSTQVDPDSASIQGAGNHITTGSQSQPPAESSTSADDATGINRVEREMQCMTLVYEDREMQCEVKTYVDTAMQVDPPL